MYLQLVPEALVIPVGLVVLVYLVGLAVLAVLAVQIYLAVLVAPAVPEILHRLLLLYSKSQKFRILMYKQS
jgi:hypothetical protein